MKKICVLTATRAEYGLLQGLIKKLMGEKDMDVHIVVTGTHLSPEFGLTYQEIEKDGIPIDEKIEILLSSDTPVSVSKSMGLAMISFAEYFERQKPDLLIVLGDRYETIAVCCASMNARIPIAHLYGGETTEGAIDESIRHAITKMSYLHFTSTEKYRKRVIQLGEDPKRVFCVGALGVENTTSKTLLTKEALEKSICFSLKKPYVIITFHPVTLENNTVELQFAALLNACNHHPEYRYLFTKANADTYGRTINTMIDEYTRENKDAIAYESLGMIRYLSAVKYAAFVMGNSSSGIVEVPSFHVPTINIGDRQKGRIQCDSIINCSPCEKEISNAMDVVATASFLEKSKNVINPYGSGDTSNQIVEEIKKTIIDHKIELKKKFYDVDFKMEG